MSGKSSTHSLSGKYSAVTEPSTSGENVFDDDEVFNDSAFLAELDYSALQTSKFFENNLNNSLNTSVLNVSALCCDEEISGYDKLTGKTWIYPTNYPIRDYQFNIIREAILKNTLVSLPTGLGKTFIAAVIMYNFYRWYPLGKIIFAAPTRPLVAQQIDACYNIVAIPPEHTIEMTGHMQVTTRKTHWQSKRVFFATPQVIYNDIKSGICPADLIRCLVIDEAHKARKNYAYCQIVGTLDDMDIKNYRILALSATPGSKVEDVIEVINNLHIANLELRTEECIDVAQYSHMRKINTVVVTLGSELTRLRDQYVEILDDYARRLKQLNILPSTLGNLSKGRIVMLYKGFQTRDRGSRHPQHGIIMKDFTLLIVLFHGLELLIKHGSRVFLNFFDEHPEKSWIQADERLMSLLERLRDDLGVNPLMLDRSVLPDGTVPEIPKDLCFGHPKFDKLKKIILEHFTESKRKGQDTRAIVFCEYRESVSLVHCLLLQCRPLITPQMFVGQGATGKDGKRAVSQKQQLRVMRSFREGLCNTLVATCVAEEGLDVGSVDLILCFDISTRSPIRLVQRCGRTGRERGGQVYILVTEGREHQTLLDCMRQKDGLNKRILQSKDVKNSLYKKNPRMIPHDFMPQCQKMFITVAKKSDPKEKSKNSIDKNKNQKDLRGMLLSKASNGSNITNKDGEAITIITKDEFSKYYPGGFNEDYDRYLPESKEYLAMTKVEIKNCGQNNSLKLCTWLEWQRKLQKTVNIGHSKDSEILASLLQYSDAKRFEETSSTQNQAINTQETFAKPKFVESPIKSKQIKKKMKCKSPAKKDGDIRALFSTATKSTKNYTKLIQDLGIKDDGSIPTSLINLLVDLNIDNSDTKKCYICQNVCDCTLIKDTNSHKNESKVSLNFLKVLNLPEIDLIDDISVECIKECTKVDIYTESQTFTEDIFSKASNFNLEIDIESFNDVEVDENKVNILNINEKSEHFNTSENNFDIGDIEDIFVDSSPEVSDKQPLVEEKPKNALEFFGLDSIDDIFADDDETFEHKSLETQNTGSKHNTELNSNNPASPSILSGKTICQELQPTSPILGTQVCKLQLNSKKQQSASTPLNGAKKSLVPFFVNHDISKGNYKSNLITNSMEVANDKSMFTITQLIEMINKPDEKDISKVNLEIPQNDNSEEVIERSPSPILLSQFERKNSVAKFNDSSKKADSSSSSASKKVESLIILDSDSESNDTLEYDLGNLQNEINSEPCKDTVQPINGKRRLSEEGEMEITPSLYLNKKQKIESSSDKPKTVQEKILLAVKSNKFLAQNFKNDHINFNVTLSPPNFISQKENTNPQIFAKEKRYKSCEEIDASVKNNLDTLEVFKRDSEVKSPKKVFENIINSQVIVKRPEKRKLFFEDSDDDFVDESFRSPKPTSSSKTNSTITNHKKRKKKRKSNSFLDLEADLSDSEQGSGDELSDDSIGSIADFICDDNNVTHHEDIHAHYLKSIKSPLKVRGGFKIPELPKRFNKEEVFSQYVEEDSYEMDSFCVDSHIGLTQVNEVSELEMAEMILENKKRRRNEQFQPEKDDDSPIIKRKNKVNQITSDSEDSS